MLPLFKSHFSIGKSILTLEAEGQRSIFQLSKDAGLKEIVLVEDSLIGFLEARKKSNDLGFDLRFGLRVSIANHTLFAESLKAEDTCVHKVIVFAKNSEGCRILNKIYSNAFCEGGGVLNENFLRSVWKEDCLKLAIPFYDSFIYNNTMLFASCMPQIDFTSPCFFVEDNGLPFDGMIRSEVESYSKRNSCEIVNAKSLYYPSYKDFLAYQTYKCICNRTYKSRTLECPNFDHQGSDKFCFEDWKELNS
tara:strand:+ start:19 stop:765 length:747 start_codon:yes stop_codon:yes gene_type:complete